MKDIRLIEILKTFNEDELKAFEKFLLSPFVKSRRNISNVLEFLKKFHPDYSSSEFTKEKMFTALFPAVVYSDKKLENLIYDLTKEAESYIMFSFFQRDEIESSIYLSKAYYERKLLNHSYRIIKSIEGKIKPGFSIKKDYFHRIKSLANLKMSYFYEMGDIEKASKSINEFHNAATIGNFVDYTWIKSIESAQSINFFMKGRVNFLKVLNDNIDTNKFIDEAEKCNSEYKQIIMLHGCILKTITEPDNEKHFFDLRDLVFKHLKEYDHEEKFELLNYLLAYAIKKHNSGMTKFVKEITDIHIKILEHDAYSPSKIPYLPVITYRNVLRCAILEKRSYTFVKNFIEKYSEKLNPEEMQSLRDFSYAYLYYYKKEFKKALDIFSTIELTNPILKMDCRHLLMEIYYELDYIEQAFSLIDSFRHFFKNNKEISEMQKRKSMQFVKFYSEMFRIKLSESKESPLVLKKEIEHMDNFIGKLWLLEKADELLKRKK